MMRVSAGHLLIGAFAILSLAAVAGGFLVIGSPAEQRLVGLDNKRIQHLDRIFGAVLHHEIMNKQLPASLDDLSSKWIRQLSDPETGEPYHYEVTGRETFKLCAVFALANTDPSRSSRQYNFGTHEKGFHCFYLPSGGSSLLLEKPSATAQ